MEVIAWLDQRLRQINNPVWRIILVFVTNFVIMLLAFELLADTVPPRLRWLPDIAWVISLILAILVTFFASASPNGNMMDRSAKAFVLIIGGALIVYAASFAMGDPISEVAAGFNQEIANIRRELENANLTDTQIEQVEGLLAESGFVSAEALVEVTSGLTQGQAEQVLEILAEGDFITREQVQGLIAAEGTRVAESRAFATATAQASFLSATATAEAQTCYVRLLTDFSSGSIRKLPIQDSEVISFVYPGNEMKATGHNGGSLNYDLWWLVELKVNEDELIGWIPSWHVAESDQTICLNKPEIPGTR